MTAGELIIALGFKVESKGAEEMKDHLDEIKEKVLHIAEALAVAELGKEMLEIASEVEQTKFSFESWLGSAEKAEEMLKSIQGITGKDIFPAETFEKAALKFRGTALEGEKLVDTLKSVGNIAAATGGNIKENFDNLIDLTFKANNGQKIMGRSLREQPVVVEAMAKKYGTTREAILRMKEISNEWLKGTLEDMGKNEKYMDGMARQAKTLSGALMIVKNFFHDIFEVVGEKLMPYVKDIVAEFTSFLGQNKELMEGALTKFFTFLAYVIGYVAVILENFIDDIGGLSEKAGFLEDVLEAVGDVLKFVGDQMVKHHKIVSLVIGVLLAWVAVQWALNVALTANPIGLVIAGVVALATVGVLLYKHWDKIKQFFIGLWNGPLSGKVIRALILPFSPFIAIVATIIRNWEPIKDFFSELWKGIVDSFDWAVDKIKKGWNYVSGAVKTVGKFFGFGKEEQSEGGESKPVKKYAVGSSFVMNDGLAYLHRGEKVMTAGQVEKTQTNNNSSSLQVNSNITVSVPVGTPDMQAGFVKKAAAQAVREEWQSILRQARVSNPIASAGRA
jgi:hypothetical protein